MTGFDPNYIYLNKAVDYILSIFTDIWKVIFSPQIDEYTFTWQGGHYDPYWSYALPLLAIGIGFILIALVKTIIRKLIGGVAA